MTVLTINLKDDPGVIAEYRRQHSDVWPEVQASLRGVGVERMNIYLLGRRLVMVVQMRDGLDYRDAFKSHAASGPRVAQWEQLMKSLQEPVPDAAPGEWWASMEPVFHLGASPADKSQEPAVAPVANRARPS